MKQINTGFRWVVIVWDAHSDRDEVVFFENKEEAESFVITNYHDALAHVCKVESRWERG